MSSFLRNNITFRRYTAERYVAFYKAKSFMLGEILDTDRHEFTQQAKETLLQYFSAATDWLTQLERDFIRRGTGIVSREDAEKCIESFADVERSMHDLMRSNPDVFTKEFVDPWTDMRERLIPYVSHAFQLQLRPDMFESFRLVAEFVIGYMNYTLFNLHELDYLVVKRPKPFLYVDKIDVTIMEVASVHTPRIRSDVYREHGLLDPYEGIQMRVKVHVDDRWADMSDARRNSFRQIRQELCHCDLTFY